MVCRLHKIMETNKIVLTVEKCFLVPARKAGNWKTTIFGPHFLSLLYHSSIIAMTTYDYDLTPNVKRRQ